MPGDYSRKTFNPKKRYSGVLMQQGRVQLDADWNEQLEIQLSRAHTEARDVIGMCGVPKKNGGFKIDKTADSRDLTISPGRIYVGGLLCELDEQATYIRQPYYPKPQHVVQSSPPATGQINLGPGNYLVLIEAWQREITALDDRLIREVALGGPDTTTRLQTVWQVRLLPVSQASPPASPPGAISCKTQFAEFDRYTAPAKGLMNARTRPPENQKDPCLLPPTAGYQRLENQLYRVEVHKGGARAAATFKWSRDNATVESAIEKFEGNTITVSEIGKDELLSFAGDRWVEIVDDESDLNRSPRRLLEIASVTPATREVTMKSSVESFKGLRRAKLRRWDQSGASATADGVRMDLAKLEADDWVDLEGGIQVSFSADDYREGDYWLIPARSATAEIEWPPYNIPNANPEPQPPAGVRHYYCRLAIIQVSGGAISLIEDCRKKFPPLTEICAEDVCYDNSKCNLDGAENVQQAIEALCEMQHTEPGIRIVSVNLRGEEALGNDTEVRPEDLARGIQIRCSDRIFERSVIEKPVCYVTLELPFPFNSIDQDLWGSDVIGFQPVVLDGDLRVEENIIVWRPARATRQWLTRLIETVRTRVRIDRVLARLTLKGNFVWSQKDPDHYLDGDAFGFQRARGQNTEIRLPSGDGRRGGAFEMWFWLTEPTLLKVNRVRFVRVQAPDDARAEVLAEITALPASPISFAFENQPNAIEVQFGNANLDFESVVAGRTFNVVHVATGDSPNGPQIIRLPENTVRYVALRGMGGGPGGVGQHRITLAANERIAIKSEGGLRLDGEPTRLPSGDDTEGGDFVLDFSISGLAPAPPTLLKVARVRVLRVRTPDDTAPQVLADIQSRPTAPVIVPLQSQPNCIEVQFTNAQLAFASVVANRTFNVVATGGIPQNAEIIQVPGNPNTVRYFSRSGIGTRLIRMTLVGDGQSAIVSEQGQRLDGEFTQLPSGDNREGGNFDFSFSVA